MEQRQAGKDKSSSLTKSYANPGLSPEALRAKRLEEQKNEIYELIAGKSRTAVDTIEDIMLNSEDDGHRLKAAQDLLNRAGMKQAQEISVTHNNQQSPVETIMDKINALKPKSDDEDIIDAEVEETSDDEQSS